MAPKSSGVRAHVAKVYPKLLRVARTFGVEVQWIKVNEVTVVGDYTGYHEPDFPKARLFRKGGPRLTMDSLVTLAHELGHHQSRMARKRVIRNYSQMSLDEILDEEERAWYYAHGILSAAGFTAWSHYAKARKQSTQAYKALIRPAELLQQQLADVPCATCQRPCLATWVEWPAKYFVTCRTCNYWAGPATTECLLDLVSRGGVFWWHYDWFHPKIETA